MFFNMSEKQIDLSLFDQPPPAALEKWQSHGLDSNALMEATSVKACLNDAVGQHLISLQALREECPDSDLTKSMGKAKENFIATVERAMCGSNPYPGKDFSLARAREVLTVARQRDWQPEHLVSITKELNGLIRNP